VEKCPANDIRLQIASSCVYNIKLFDTHFINKI